METTTSPFTEVLDIIRESGVSNFAKQVLTHLIERSCEFTKAVSVTVIPIASEEMLSPVIIDAASKQIDDLMSASGINKILRERGSNLHFATSLGGYEGGKFRHNSQEHFGRCTFWLCVSGKPQKAEWVEMPFASMNNSKIAS